MLPSLSSSCFARTRVVAVVFSPRAYFIFIPNKEQKDTDQQSAVYDFGDLCLVLPCPLSLVPCANNMKSKTKFAVYLLSSVLLTTVRANSETMNHHRPTLGSIFTNKKAASAFKKNKLSSKFESIQRLRVVFINELKEPLRLCWVSGDGQLRHFYKLNTSTPLLTKLDKDGVQLQYCNSHMENTCVGHAFVLGMCVEDNDDSNDKKIGDIVGGYRPLIASLADDEEAGNSIHIVTITERPRARAGLRCRTRVDVELQVKQYAVDPTPFDTSKKEYQEITISGWKCMCEHGLFDDKDKDSVLQKVRKQLEIDLQACSQKLPPKACKLLKECIPIWINKSQKYGPKCAPVQGRAMCFHHEPEWLSKNGMSTKKCGGVEVYEACGYFDDHGLWYGEGGILLHELSHAWHKTFVKDGYSNDEIEECYKAALTDELYESVQVHNHEGSTDERKAYAATNQFEYFAELSVAFLGGVGTHKDLEYNKWYPFNRKQIKTHDPRAYKLLHKMWGVEELE